MARFRRRGGGRRFGGRGRGRPQRRRSFGRKRRVTGRYKRPYQVIGQRM